MRLLKVQSVENITKILTEKFSEKQRTTKINVLKANSYYLAEDIKSNINVPQFNKSRVDGYAVLSKDCKVASEASPILLELIGSLNIGEENNIVLKENQCMYIPTGGMLPENADAMVMIEHTEKFSENLIGMTKSTTLGQNITLIGDDVKKDTIIAKKGTVINSRLISVLVSLGVFEITVFLKPKVFILSSGDELIDCNDNLKIGQTREINSIYIDNCLKNYNFEIVGKQLIKDDRELYKNTLLEAINLYSPDIIITSGGSSKGDKDYTVSVFEELTNNVFCEGIGIKPGKPTILADCEEQMFIGLPGHPVSSYMVLHHVILNSYFNSIDHNNSKTTFAKIKHNIANNQGRQNLILVQLVKEANEYFAIPMYYNSTNIFSLAVADGYFVIDENTEGVKENEIVEVYLFNEK